MANFSIISTPSLRSKRFREVREQRKSEKRDFRCFALAKNGARAKKRKEGEEMLADKPLDFENRLLDLSRDVRNNELTERRNLDKSERPM